MKKILRNKNILTDQKDLIKIKSFKKFPVFMGTTNKKLSSDLRADMNFYISKKTGIVQLNPILPFNIIYKEGHNSGLVGKLWQKHHIEFSKFIRRFNPNSVLEIGGGHGILSKYYFESKKIDWTIIEPNPSPVKGCRAKFIKGFFNKDIIRKIKFDSIVHSHVLEHVFYPKKFMLDVSKSLKLGQIMFFSVPNLREMVNRKYTNALNFEHTLYLDQYIIDYLLKLNSLKIIQKKLFKKDHSIFYAVKKVKKIQNLNFKNQYKKNLKLFNSFFNNFSKTINELNNKIKSHENKNIFLFGGHVFSQFLINSGLLNERISFILDNDVSKQNKRLYGTDLIIKSPKIVKKKLKPLVVLKAGVYNKEIKKQILKINKSTKFI
jgi:2-polyprenyl-3-methyl-5-hydroxy-6-metoxy-1,4-benzoquinol methylase